jgi:beta-aspartyl-peptidase (threonine type)
VSLALISDRPGTALSEPAREKSPGPKEAIRKVLAAGDVAWNKGDLKGFVDNYWKSPDTTLFKGKEVTRGWQAIRERYQMSYQGEGKEMGQLTVTELEIDVLDPESAFVRGRWNVVFSKGKTLGGLFTPVMKKTPDGWRVVHDHASVG